MKKFFLVVVFLAGITFIINAQVDGRALGLRFGFGGELSYQHPLSEINRLEFDLGLNSWQGDLFLSGLYHVVNDLSSLADGFNWYYGAGLGAGLGENYVVVGVLGQIGIEYNLKKHPFQFSLDWRPGVFITPVIDLGWTGVAASIRYKF